ncbi:MAG: flavodoxin family protein [Ruminococcaceae bacterium]|nr:flavodoxin family protein [Oscillospiraceae bacterium]
MKVLLINGSPRQHGCTFTALSEVANALNLNEIETEIYWIGNKPIAGCISCRTCAKTGKCSIDDQVNELKLRLSEVDGIVIGSPVYYAGGAGSLIAFLDRLFYSGATDSLAGKPGAVVVSCRRGGATATFDQLNKFFTISNMPIVPSNYWNQVHGNTPEETKQDLEGLQTMRVLGGNMAWLIKCIEAGKKQGIKYASTEQKIRTNFIR